MLKTVGFPSTRTGDQTIVNGNLVIGTAGKGIDFSADPNPGGMTSELLDDYEEGTFTPDQGAGLTVVGAFSSEARYTKVGRLVTIQGYLAGATSIAASTGQLFSNAPFTTGITCTGSVAGYSGVGNSTCVIPNGSTNVICNTAIGASSALLFTLTYSV
jgi:hypothetical protein